ncbi:MAG: class I SAM-dependent methyltransferase [Candidatus Limnocylindrales bacterium]
MVTPEELRYLYWLGRDFWSGAADVVEVGPWLGGSTWYLAAGMRSNPRREPGRKLHVIDNFRWRPFMAERASLDLKPDDSFRPFFEDNLAGLQDLLSIHEAALLDDDSAILAESGGVRSDSADIPPFSNALLPGPVSIAFVDGAKSWRAIRHLLIELEPGLIPGETVLVFQDFQAALAYWVPMAVGLMLTECPGSLAPLHILRANTISFRVAGRIPASVLTDAPEDIENVSREEGERLLAHVGSLLEARGERLAAATVGLSHVAFLATMGATDDALSAFRRVEERWPLRASSNYQLEAVRSWLAKTTGHQLPPSRQARALGLWIRARQKAARLIPAKAAA